MAWQTSDRKSRLPDNWQLLRLRVLRRDGYRCRAVNSNGQRCGERANQVDHIVAGDNHDLGNLQALCQWHHSRKSSAEGIAARKERGGYRSTRRQGESHPLDQLRKD